MGGDRPRKYWNDLKKKLLQEGYDQLSETIGQLRIEEYEQIVRLTMTARADVRPLAYTAGDNRRRWA